MVLTSRTCRRKNKTILSQQAADEINTKKKILEACRLIAQGKAVLEIQEVSEILIPIYIYTTEIRVPEL